MSALLLDAQAGHKSYGRTQAPRGASLSVAKGEIVAITGPSGSDKSTLLLCAAGVLRPESARITVAGQQMEDMSDRAYDAQGIMSRRSR